MTPPSTQAKGFPVPGRRQQGRVLRVHGLVSVVETEDGRQFRCGVRRGLRTLATDERNIVPTGDRVWFLPSLKDEGVIERVEPRHELLTRASRGREHVLVAAVHRRLISARRYTSYLGLFAGEAPDA